MQQAVIASQGVLSRHRVTAEATPCGERELKFTMVITAGSHSFRPADGVALSRSDISKREYIGEVTEIYGIMLTVSIVWPTNSDDTSRKNILEGKWYLYKFPSLVGYRRTAAALKALHDATPYGQSLFEGIVGSFCLNDQSSQDTNKDMDEDVGQKIGKFSSRMNCVSSFLGVVISLCSIGIRGKESCGVLNIKVDNLCIPFKSLARCELLMLAETKTSLLFKMVIDFEIHVQCTNV